MFGMGRMCLGEGGAGRLGGVHDKERERGNYWRGNYW